MKFIPMFQSEIKNDKVYNRIYDELRCQSTTKSKDVTMHLPLQDIFKQKSYLGDRSMKQIIHSAICDEDATKEIPLFKHITRKWINKENTTKYEVVLQCKMIDKASKFIRTMKKNIIEAFGDEVQKHFLQRSDDKVQSQDRNNKAGIDTKLIQEMDTEMENLLIEDDIPDTFARLYLEGMDKVTGEFNGKDENQQQDLQGGMLISEGYPTKEDDLMTTNN